MTLAPADPALAAFLHEYRRDPVTLQFNPLEPSTVESLRERLAKAGTDLAEWDRRDAFFWFVQAEGRVVGNVTLQNLKPTMLTAEIGYGLIASARGRGLATEAVRELTRRVFVETPLRKLIALVHEDNRASRRVMEKVGYREEGRLREHFLVNGQPATEIIYGILRRELIAPSG